MKVSYYDYEAYDNTGKLVKGQLSAENEREVLSSLQSKQLIPFKIELASNIKVAKQQTIKQKELIDFTNGLCTLVEAHVPLDRSLLLLEGIIEDKNTQQLINAMRREVKEGKSLADVMETRPESFSRMYINIIRAGEEGGILDQLLPTLARFLAETDETRRHVVSAMIYPMVLMVVGILSVVLLLLFVVPQFAQLFENAGSNIPDSAALLLNLSHWLSSYGWSLLFIPVILGSVWKWWGSSAENRLQRDQFLLLTPLFGRILLYLDIANFARTLGALLGAGVPLLRGLRVARGVVNNSVLTQKLHTVEEDVRGGSALGKALEKSRQFPVLFFQLITVGEESGRTAEILQQLASTYDKYIRQQVSRLVALLEPLLILALGIFVGGIVIVMLSAVFSINDVSF